METLGQEPRSHVQLKVEIRAALRRDLKLAAAEQGRSMRSLIEESLEESLAREIKRGK